MVPAFIQQALLGEPLTVFGDGGQTRSFCFVSDLVEGIYRLLQSDLHQPCNIGNPSEMTVLQFAQRIRAATGSSSEIVFRPLPVDDPKTRQPDITQARTRLGWEPVVSLDEGLAHTIDYFRAGLGATATVAAGAAPAGGAAAHEPAPEAALEALQSRSTSTRRRWSWCHWRSWSRERAREPAPPGVAKIALPDEVSRACAAATPRRPAAAGRVPREVLSRSESSIVLPGEVK